MIFGQAIKMGWHFLAIYSTRHQEFIQGSPFEFEVVEPLVLGSFKNLGLSVDYVPDWKLWEGLRELL